MADIQSATAEIRRIKKEERKKKKKPQDENILVCPIQYGNHKKRKTRMWANAQPDGRPAEHRWRPLFNAAKFG